jgi:type I restriction-modification system DNA methylase subunit
MAKTSDKAPKPKAAAKESAQSGANLGFEAKLWLTADKLRNNMDAAEYKHVVLGLIFLKYISDTFDEHHAKLVAGKGDYAGATTRRLAVMNLALRGIEADFGPEQADTFRRDLHPDLRADYVLANPPFNDSDWFRKDDDVRWQFGIPPKGNANFAWVSHFIHHLAPNGMAGFVLANGSMSSNQSGEGEGAGVWGLESR